MTHREQQLKELKWEFHVVVPVVVHWNSKLLDDISGKPKKVERLLILVTGFGF